MKWLSLYIGGQKWSVHLVSPKNKNLREGSERYVGRCLFDKCRIYIDKTQDEQAREDTLLHELLHVVVRLSGMWELLENELGEAAAGRVDESFVGIGTPILHRLLKDLGFRFPRGIAA